MGEIAKVTHLDLARARVLQVLKNKTNFDKLVQILCERVTGLEDVLFSVHEGYRLSKPPVGAQLDVLGVIVGEPRDSETDDSLYLARIKARVRTNKSSGTIEEIYSIFTALGVTSMRLDSQPPAGLSLKINQTLTSAQAARYVKFLLAAKMGGVRAILEWFQGTAANTFAANCQTHVTTSAGSGTVKVITQGTSGFQPSGQIAISASGGGVDANGDPTSYEVYTYAQINATEFQGLTPPLVSTWGVGSKVTQYPFPTGKGNGDSTNGATGGELAGADGG